jgi:hypothetical protein
LKLLKYSHIYICSIYIYDMPFNCIGGLNEDLFGCLEVCEEASKLNLNVSLSPLTSSMGVVMAVGRTLTSNL